MEFQHMKESAKISQSLIRSRFAFNLKSIKLTAKFIVSHSDIFSFLAVFRNTFANAAKYSSSAS